MGERSGMPPGGLAAGFFGYARQFASAAEAARVAGVGTPTFEVVYFLYGHAFELGLKAFLAAKGYDDSRLKSLGHDLAAVLNAARCEGLGDHLHLKADHEGALKGLNVYYSSKWFEYYQRGMAGLPTLDHVAEAVCYILKGVERVVRVAQTQAAKRLSGGCGAGHGG